MIARINGEVIDKYEDHLIIDVGGVGYEVFVSIIDLEKTQLSNNATFYIYEHIRENSQDLFGFISQESKRLFSLLISVSGVGPKMAMNILSLGEQTHISQAIASNNSNYISGATGVGKRLAERVCVDLKEKIISVINDSDMSDGFRSEGLDDALDALIGLGYSRSQASRALSRINPSLPIEERIKLGLKEL